MPTKLLLMIVAVASFFPTPGRADAGSTPDTSRQERHGATEATSALHPDAIESVTPVYRSSRSGRHLAGVAIKYRPGVGVTASQMQERLDHQVVNGRYHSSSDSPFSLKDVDASARAEGDRLLVQITSTDSRSARDIVGRTNELAVGAASGRP
jgi:hypothetical protein